MGLTWEDDGHGSNRVSAILDAHVIQEEFDGTPSIPLKGISLSTFNTKLGKWQQTSVDNSGSYLDLIGEFKDGEMILEREAIIQDKTVKQRMVFYNIAD